MKRVKRLLAFTLASVMLVTSFNYGSIKVEASEVGEKYAVEQLQELKEAKEDKEREKEITSETAQDDADLKEEDVENSPENVLSEEKIDKQILSSENEYTVTFDAGEGSFSKDKSDTIYTVSLPANSKIGGEYPNVIAPEGKVFKGWYTVKNGNDVDENSEVNNMSEFVVSSDVTFYAAYEDGYIVTFHSNKPGVKLDGISETIKITVPKGLPLRYEKENSYHEPTEDMPSVDVTMVDGELPLVGQRGELFYATNPDGEGLRYNFLNGTITQVDLDYGYAESIGTNGYIPTSDIDFYVMWDKPIEITLNGNGRLFKTNIYDELNANIKQLVSVSSDGKTITLKAAKGSSAQVLTYFENNRAISFVDEVDEEGYYVNNYYLQGWYRDKDCNSYVNNGAIVYEDSLFFAKWVERGQYNGGDGEEKKEITFDAGNGYFGDEYYKSKSETHSYSDTYSKCYVEVPKCEDPELVFEGWYTDSECKNFYARGDLEYGYRLVVNVKKCPVDTLFAGYRKPRIVSLSANGGYFSQSKDRINNSSKENKSFTVRTVKEKVCGIGVCLSDYEKEIRRDGNKVFAGWYTNSECISKAKIVQYDGQNYFIPSEDETVLYAKWVTPKSVKLMLREPSEIHLNKGDKRKLNLSVEGCEFKDVVWQVRKDYAGPNNENGQVISVSDQGEIEALGDGAASVYAEYNGVKSDWVYIRVGKVEISMDIDVDPGLLVIPANSTVKRKIKAIVPDDLKQYGLSWFSSNKDVVNVEVDENDESIAWVTPNPNVTEESIVSIRVRAKTTGYMEECRVIVTPPSEEPAEVIPTPTPTVPDEMWYTIDGKKYEQSGVSSVEEVYTGNPITFNDRISVYQGEKKLVENRDYKITYQNNTLAAMNDSNKAPTVTITGKSNYSGKADFRFSILRADLAEVNLTTEENVPVYAGRTTKLSSVQPAYIYNGKKLVANKDYVLEYYKESDEGFTEIANPSKEYLKTIGDIYHIKAYALDKQGCNFTGDVIKDVIVTVVDKATTVTVSSLKVVDAKGRPIVLPYREDEDYDLGRMFDNSYDDNEELVAFVKDGRKTLEYGKDYIVDPVEGCDYHSTGVHSFRIVGLDGIALSDEEIEAKAKAYSGSKLVTFTIKGKPFNTKTIKITGLLDAVEYTGSEISYDELFNVNDRLSLAEGWEMPTLYTTMKIGKVSYNTPLTPYEDYSITMTNNGSVGSFVLEYKGINGYDGTIRKTIKINPYDFTRDKDHKLSITVDNAEFLKTGAKPSPVVMFDGVILEEGTDYSLAYKNNTKIFEDEDALDALKPSARPAVVVKGKNNFKGSDSNSFFCITKADISRVKLTVNDVVYNKKGRAGYFISTPSLKDDDKAITIGKNKDIEKITNSSYRYTYAEDTLLDNDDYREAGADVLKTDKVKPGTRIKVSVLVNCSEKSSYKSSEGGTELSGYYRIIDTGTNISSYTVKIDTSKLSYNLGKEVVPEKDAITIFYKNKGKPVYLTNDDYDIISIKNNKFIGKATIVLKGKGQYGGTKSVQFNIRAKGLK